MVFDTETTGLPKSRNSYVTDTEEFPYIVQLSYIVYDMSSNELCCISDSIIKLDEQIDIPIESENIHCISKSISREKGVPIKDVLLKFIRDLEDCHILVAHNIEFDVNMVTVELIRLNRLTDTEEINEAYAVFSAAQKCCTMIENKTMCNIVAKTKAGREYVKYPSLTELHQTIFNRVPNYMHNSLNDILICLRCFYFQKMNEDICEKNEELAKLLKYLL